MLNNENYYSNSYALKYMSASQFKSFQNCEAQALAEIKGEFKRETTTAMLIGSYVDSWFEGTLDKFKEAHTEIFTQKGTLRAEYTQADEIIARVQRDEKFMRYMNGEHQKIFVGTIEGVEFKGKLDAYHPGKAIVDLKTCKDFEPVWTKNGKKIFVEAYGYDIQLAIYRELVKQNTGEELSCYICAVTKEKVPNIAILQIDKEKLDECLEIVKATVRHFQSIKNGEIEPVRCCKCDYCKSTAKAEVINYRDLNPELFREKPSQATQEPVSVSSIVSLPSIENTNNGENNVILEGKKSKKKKHKKNGKVIIIKL